ncbi:uncharacterized protein ACHE_51003A [Aspergillus chevalieri]|uniref:Uncharacterized protein n=1 Tax=Aspergillus chevalieri TaxID=182096 RepID=A0A7R7VS44_ASPCH|nr:uncharacterized protein ACHE_51003A [Aspergillus chevalieri]BCR89805.1 hypothetical protein ACHE_51003A [Aspergillus chevalieri]
MSTLNFPRPKRQSLGSRYRPLSQTSQFLLHKLGGSSRPLPQGYANPSPRIGTVDEDCILYNGLSDPMEVDYSRDRHSIDSTRNNYSKRGSLYMANSDIDTQSISSKGSITSDMSVESNSEAELPVCLTPGRLSLVPHPSNVHMGIQDLMQGVNRNCDSYIEDSGINIAPAPLRPRKRQNNKKCSHDKTNRALNQAETHFDYSDTDAHAHDRRAQSTVEYEIEQHLAQLEHQTAELREILTACEAKLSQMTQQLAQSTPEKRAVSFEPKAAEYRALLVQDSQFPLVGYRNESRRHGEPYMDFLHVDFANAEQVNLLSHLNTAGTMAQRRRGRLPRAWAV